MIDNMNNLLCVFWWIALTDTGERHLHIRRFNNELIFIMKFLAIKIEINHFGFRLVHFHIKN